MIINGVAYVMAGRVVSNAMIINEEAYAMAAQVVTNAMIINKVAYAMAGRVVANAMIFNEVAYTMTGRIVANPKMSTRWPTPPPMPCLWRYQKAPLSRIIRSMNPEGSRALPLFCSH